MRFMFFMVNFFALPTTRFRRLGFSASRLPVFRIPSSFFEASESGSLVWYRDVAEEGVRIWELEAGGFPESSRWLRSIATTPPVPDRKDFAS
jgi:hypothetical protein